MAYALGTPWSAAQHVLLSTFGGGWTNGARQQSTTHFSTFYDGFASTIDHIMQEPTVRLIPIWPSMA
jgi:hypothetical protein